MGTWGGLVKLLLSVGSGETSQLSLCGVQREHCGWVPGFLELRLAVSCHVDLPQSSDLLGGGILIVPGHARVVPGLLWAQGGEAVK